MVSPFLPRDKLEPARGFVERLQIEAERWRFSWYTRPSVFLGLRINFTSSLERGFYVVNERPSANLVEFCPEGEAGTIALQRAYCTAEGTCPDGGSPLIKQIAAVRPTSTSAPTGFTDQTP